MFRADSKKLKGQKAISGVYFFLIVVLLWGEVCNTAAGPKHYKTTALFLEDHIVFQ